MKYIFIVLIYNNPNSGMTHPRSSLSSTPHPHTYPTSWSVYIQGRIQDFHLAHSERRPQIFIPKRKSTSIVSSNWQQKFLYFHYKSVKLGVLRRQNKIWTFGNPFHLKSCQFAPKVVIFNLCICCQFEDSQIISPKIIPMSHRNI